MIRIATTAALMSLIAAPLMAQTPIGSLPQRGGMTIEGTVTDVFGNRFVLQDDSGRVLVETGPDRNRRLDIKPGEKLRVVGKPDDGGFDAFTIRRGDGSEIVLRKDDDKKSRERAERSKDRDEGPKERRERDKRESRRGPPPPMPAASISADGVLKAVTDAGYKPEGSPERHPRHFEVNAVNADGERVRVHADLDGRVYREVWDRGRGFDERPSEAEARRFAETGGYTITGPLEQHPRHYEALATDANGRQVRLHLHADGIRDVDTMR